MSFLAAWLTLAAVALAAAAILWRRHAQRQQLRVLRAEWGQWRDVPRDMTAIARYFRACADAGASSPSLDDRTWQDLNMDDVFRLLDRTSSLVGQQALYTRLRSTTGAHLEAFEAFVNRFGKNTLMRERAQMTLSALGNVDGYSLWWLAQPGAIEQSGWHVAFPLLGASMLVAVAVVPFYPVALLVVVAGVLVNLTLRATAASHLRVATDSFRQVGPLLAAASRLRTLAREDVAAMTAPLTEDLRRLSRLRRIAGWTGRNTSGAISGDLGSLLVEYLNLVFCLDGIALFFGASELEARHPELLHVVDAVGDVDAAVSVASYRAGTPAWTRPILRSDGSSIVLHDIRHPLLPDAVANSIALGPPYGVIITGSNMSGKSTFLRTIGVTTVLAQTINTCLAGRYEAPPLIVRSCIGRADDPSAGRSYYLVEVDSILNLVQATATSPPMLILFDELFRGTNAVERIAAGEAVLVALLTPAPDTRGPSHIIVAATHDHELVDLLRDAYSAHHFTDSVDDSGLTFDYQLRPGPATSRNAIALLTRRGAPPELVRRAAARAGQLETDRMIGAGEARLKPATTL